MKIKEITRQLEKWAPLSYQESYDNSGLIIGDPEADVIGVTISLDVTEAVIQETIANGHNLIVAHHPFIFKGLKRLTGRHWVERCAILAIKNDIAIYAIHTNLDHINSGVNRRICDTLGLKNVQILDQKKQILTKLETFVPTANKDQVLAALYEAGVGNIGNYDHCSFQTTGTGTFRPGESANPTIGSQLSDESVDETKIEVIFPNHLSNQIIRVLKKAHPYEEVAYYLTTLENENQEVGAGMIGELSEPINTLDFLESIKYKMNTQCIRHTNIHCDKVQKIAVCGGAGSFLLSKAINAGAEVFITADFKYHDFFEADNKIVIADIGHYESEQYTKELLYDFLSKKFANIALRLSEVQTNPINYL